MSQEGIKTVIEFNEKFELKVIVKSEQIEKVKNMLIENKEDFNIMGTRFKEFYEVRVKNVNIKRSQTIKQLFDEAKITIY